MSSVTHPSTMSSSSRRLNSAAMLTELGDMFYRIPRRLDEALFSDDDDEEADASKAEIDDDMVDDENDAELDEEVGEESFDATDFLVEPNRSHSQATEEVNISIGSFSIQSENSITQRNLHSSLQSTDRAYKSHNMLHTTEREKMQNEKRFQFSAESGSRNSKHPVKSKATSSRPVFPRQDDNTIDDFNWKKKEKRNLHQADPFIKPQPPTMEKIDGLPNSGSYEQGRSFRQSETLVASHTPLSRSKSTDKSKVHKEHKEYVAIRTVEDKGVNSKIKTYGNPEQANNASRQKQKPTPDVPQAKNPFMKPQPRTMEKIDELPDSNSNEQGRSLRQSEKLVASHTPLARLKSVEKSKVHKEYVGTHAVEDKGVNSKIKPHGNPEQVSSASRQKRKPAPDVRQETSKSDKDVEGQKSCNKSSDDDDGGKMSEAKSLMPDKIITVNKKKFMILTTIGKGGSCKVYSVYDASTKSVFAVKCVKLANVEKSIMDGYKKEIEYLTKLQGSNRVIKMYDYEYLDDELRVLLEKGDTDFAHYIANEMKIKPLSPIMIKFYWSQMLEAVAEIHKLGIVHSDLKPGNFLLVAGQLKLIDFGIATSVPTDMTSAFREDTVGTLNFISPEALTSHNNPHCQDSQGPKRVVKVSIKADVWSLGCILYNLVYGYTPFAYAKYMADRIQAVCSHPIKFPPLDDPLLLDVLKCCLVRNPKERASVEDLLKHPYLTSEAKQEIQSTPVKSSIKFQDMLAQIQSLTPGRMSVVTEVLQKMKSTKKQ